MRAECKCGCISVPRTAHSIVLCPQSGRAWKSWLCDVLGMVTRSLPLNRVFQTGAFQRAWAAERTPAAAGQRHKSLACRGTPRRRQKLGAIPVPVARLPSPGAALARPPPQPIPAADTAHAAPEAPAAAAAPDYVKFGFVDQHKSTGATSSKFRTDVLNPIWDSILTRGGFRTS